MRWWRWKIEFRKHSNVSLTWVSSSPDFCFTFINICSMLSTQRSFFHSLLPRNEGEWRWRRFDILCYWLAHGNRSNNNPIPWGTYSEHNSVGFVALSFSYKLIGIKACIILLSEVLPLTSGSKHSFRCFESVLLKSELVRELLLVTQVSLSTHITTPHWVYLHFHSQSTKVLRAPHPPMWPSLQEPTFVWTLEPRVCASPGLVFLPGSYCLRVPWSLLTRFFSLLIILSWLELDLKQPFCWLLFFF